MRLAPHPDRRRSTAGRSSRHIAVSPTPGLTPSRDSPRCETERHEPGHGIQCASATRATTAARGHLIDGTVRNLSGNSPIPCDVLGRAEPFRNASSDRGKLRVETLLALSVARRAQGIVPIQFPAPVLGVVLKHQE
jgi:hypothetical protein